MILHGDLASCWTSLTEDKCSGISLKTTSGRTSDGTAVRNSFLQRVQPCFERTSDSSPLDVDNNLLICLNSFSSTVVTSPASPDLSGRSPS